MTNSPAPGWVFSFRADRLDEFHAKINKANKRLAKAGAPQFAPEISFEDREEYVGNDPLGLRGLGLDPDPHRLETILVRYAVASLPEYRLSLGDYTFVAALVPEEAGMTVHCAPGQSLEGWVRPPADDMSCDHCQTKRFRNRLYVVRDEKSGELLQLGHNCIELYTGLEPKGLWALSFDQELREFSERDEGLGGGSRDYSVSIDSVLALSHAYSDGGRKYVSRAKADEWGKESTVSRIYGHMFAPPKPASPGSRNYAEWAEYLEAADKAGEVRKDEALLAAIKASAESLRPGTDYADNMHIVLAAESGHVSRRNVGVLASLLAVYRRGLEDGAKREGQPQAAKGFLGKPGDKLRGLEVTAKIVRVSEGYYGMSTWMIAKTDSGHEVVWSASGAKPWEPGDRIKIGSLTIKGHGNYQGTDQTIITNGRNVEVLAEAA
jgi:hypothetical protein